MKNRDKFYEVFGFHADEVNVMPCNQECTYRKACEENDIGECRAKKWWDEEYKEQKK